jgi:RpiR family carbohydrate utilization transcriptional regulator
MTILHELISFYNACPVGSIYHVIAARLLQNLNAIGNLSIEELAILCFSSPTAISRIVRKLGCSSYKEFKRDISRALSEYPLRNRCLPYNDMTISSSTQTYFKYFHTMLDSLESDINPAYLDQVCNAIHSHARVRLYMAFSTSHAKRQFQLDLVISGKETAFISNPADCFTDIETNDKDSFFIFSCNS